MLIIIAALALNRVIGNNNDLPWYFPEDLKRFKTLTQGHPIIMGWNTFISILDRFQKRDGEARLLPGRKHFVLTSKSQKEIDATLAKRYPYFSLGDAEQFLVFCKSMDEAVSRASVLDSEVYAIGGERVFQEALKIAKRLELTVINKDYEGDAYFPVYDQTDWQQTFEDDHGEFKFLTLDR